MAKRVAEMCLSVASDDLPNVLLIQGTIKTLIYLFWLSISRITRNYVQGETELSFRLKPYLAKITSSLTVLVQGFV